MSEHRWEAWARRLAPLVHDGLIDTPQERQIIDKAFYLARLLDEHLPAPQPPDVERLRDGLQAIRATSMDGYSRDLAASLLALVDACLSRKEWAAPQPPSPACTCDGDPEYCFAHAAAAPPEPLDVERLRDALRRVYKSRYHERFAEPLAAEYARLSRKEPSDE